MAVYNLLAFSQGNAKLPLSTLIFSLPAGHTCPGANLCLSKAHRHTGKIKDGKQCQFRCFAASAEALYPSTRDSRWRNFDLIKTQKSSDAMADLIYTSIIPHLNRKRRSSHRVIQRVRIHEGGDFYSLPYMEAWIKVASRIPNRIFYAYTKCLPFWLELKDSIPSNLVFTASAGGQYDALLPAFSRVAYVVSSTAEATARALPIDHDDAYAYEHPAQAFAHLVHGVQPAGSQAMADLQARRRNHEFTGYGVARRESI